MIITAQDIQQIKERLIERHPGLEKIRVVSRDEAFPKFSWKLLSAFIDSSWQDTYGQQERFNYDHNYLEWVFGMNGGIDSELSHFALDDGLLCGVLLYTPRTIFFNNREFLSGIKTGLSIAPNKKGIGLAKYLICAADERERARLDGIIWWFDRTVRTEQNSYKILSSIKKDYFEQRGFFRLNVRVFDYERASENATLKFYEKPVLSLMSALPVQQLKSNVSEIQEQDCEEVCCFINRETQRKGLGRIFTPQELMRYAVYKSGDSVFSTMGLYQRISGKIQGVMIGYPIEIIGKSKDRVCFLDYAVLGDSCDRKELLSQFEAKAWEQWNVYGMITADPRFGLCERYAPSRQLLECYSIPYKQDFTISDQTTKKYLFIDHK